MSDRHTLVVVSYYNAVPPDRLDNLLWQLARIPAGCTFDVVVVINRALDQAVSIEDKYPQVRFLYRPNNGYNIGAWQHGWQENPGYDAYVFLQDECLIARQGWLRSLVRRAASGKGKLVGESLVDPAESWEQSQASYEDFYARSGLAPARWSDDGGDLNTPNAVRRFLRSQAIPSEPTMRHLRSLVLCAPGHVLTAMGGFPAGNSYRDAVGAEVGCSQRATACGFSVEQAALLPYTFVIHPQWMAERCDARTGRGVMQALFRRWVPTSARLRLRSARRRWRTRSLGPALP
ncbi:MAG: glycosyltransferase [Pseudomonadota bacterium]|nr:glycosyltransferase [Pseudomonadota bacterium]